MFVPQSCTTFVWLLNGCILERMICLVLIFGVIGLSYLKLLMEGGQEFVTSPKPLIESDHLADKNHYHNTTRFQCALGV